MVRMGRRFDSGGGLHQADDQRKCWSSFAFDACEQAKLAVWHAEWCWMGACRMESTSLVTIRIVDEPVPDLRPSAYCHWLVAASCSRCGPDDGVVRFHRTA
jgi:hypothetical protein